MASGDTKTNQYLDIAANGEKSDFPASCCETRSQTLIREVGERIMDLEDEVQEMKDNPDVADIVATYADLQAYDTQHLTDKDIIRVLTDETHDGESTYYRYNKASDTFTYIGTSKQYSNFVGTDGVTAGTAGLVPAPATTDDGKFLKADGTWDTAGGGGGDTVYSTVTTSDSATGGAVYIGNLGTDQTEVVDPTATDSHYRYFWALPANNSEQPKNNSINILGQIGGTASQNTGNVVIGSATVAESSGTLSTNNIVIGCGSTSGRTKAGANSRVTGSVLIGRQAQAPTGGGIVAIGQAANVSSSSLDVGNVVIGQNALVPQTVKSSVALGPYAEVTRNGEVNVGLSDWSSEGYNSTCYRVIGGVHDGQQLHDAATVAQGNTLATSAPTTSTVGVLGQLYTDTTNMRTYQCTAISGSTYTWTQRW